MRIVLLIGLILTVVACTPTPKDIGYGSDLCHFCKMTIIDQQHAAELVTDKGKIFMFDAIECMIHYQKEHSGQSYSFELVNDYQQPGALLESSSATFLISQNIPSPMGAFLSAFKNKEAAKKVQEEKGGDLYTWEELFKVISK